jgi:glycosyltransferase involved in cell wall biosynthesis
MSPGWSLDDFLAASEKSADKYQRLWHDAEMSNSKATPHQKPQKVTAVIPNWNNERYIDSVLDSLLSQKGVELEIQVIDNCSQDMSWEIISRYTERYDNITSYQMSSNSGPHVTGTCLLKGVMTKYVLFASGNDIIIDPFFVKNATQFLETHQEIVLVYGKHCKEDSKIEPDQYCFSAKYNNSINGPHDLDQYYQAKAFRFLQTTALYTSGEPLWGLYRSEPLKRIPMIYGYGADHLLISCISLFGNIAGIRKIVRQASPSFSDNVELRKSQDQSLYSLDYKTEKTLFKDFNMLSLIETYRAGIEGINMSMSFRKWLYKNTIDVMLKRFPLIIAEEASVCSELLRKDVDIRVDNIYLDRRTFLGHGKNADILNYIIKNLHQ